MFDDQIMDWIVEALHQSHADEKRFREDAISRLQEEQAKIQNRLDRLGTVNLTQEEGTGTMRPRGSVNCFV